MFAGHDTTTKAVGCFDLSNSFLALAAPVVDARPVGACHSPQHSREAPKGDCGNAGENKEQG